MGDLVHNKYSLEKIKDRNIHFINTKNQISFLTKLNSKNVVIVFPAHGYKDNVLKYANDNFRHVYQLTCPFINKNIKLIKSLIKQSEKVYFFGKKNHAETECVLSIDSSIKSTQLFKKINQITKHTYLVSQSTIPTYLFYEKVKNKNISYISTTCDATNLRYKNVLNLSMNIDLLLVVGDKNSFNTQMLLKTSKIKSILVESIKDLKLINFKNINTCAITSGTSASKEVVDEIIEQLVICYKYAKPSKQ
jgi:4-hydroxy-3-methylbut-2-enyl diphosphate reductase